MQQKNCLLDVYSLQHQYQTAKTGNLANLSFLAFATKFRLVNNKLAPQSKNIVPRVFPIYSSNPKSPNFGLYCKYQLLRYKPWTIKEENAWVV